MKLKHAAAEYRKDMVAKMKTWAILLACAVLAGSVCGCASSPKGPTDEEQIMSVLLAMKAGVLGKDIKQVEPTVSEEFYYPALGDKAGALDMLQQGMDMGIVDNGEIDLTKMEIKVEGDTATAGPVEASSPMGSATVSFTLKKAKGAWTITGGEASGF